MRTESKLLFKHGRETLAAQQGVLLVGSAVKWELSDQTKKKVAHQIHESLLIHKDRMRVLEPDALLDSMNDSRFVLLMTEKDTPLACAQVWPHPLNSSVIEVGTWLRFKEPGYENGAGATVMKHAAQLGMLLPDAAMVIALVKDDNSKAKDALSAIGGAFYGLSKL